MTIKQTESILNLSVNTGHKHTLEKQIRSVEVNTYDID